MCIAIVKLPEANIPEEHLRSSWIANPDGAGFAYVHEGKVQISKGFMALKDFLDAYTQAVATYSTSTFLVHFRIRSMGDKDPNNTHPYVCDSGAMIHNGTISGTGADYGKGPSDTAKFVERYNKDLTLDFLTENSSEINTALGHNKLAFLFHDGQHYIANAAHGWWEGGVWYSNRSYMPSKYTPYLGMDGSVEFDRYMN